MGSRRWRTVVITLVAIAIAAVLILRLMPRPYPTEARWIERLDANEATLTADAELALARGSTSEVRPNNDVFTDVHIDPVWDTDETVGLGENEDVAPAGNGVYFNLDESSGGGWRGHRDLLYWPGGSGRDRLFACGQDGDGMYRRALTGNWYEEQHVDCDDFIVPEMSRFLVTAVAVVGGLAVVASALWRSKRRQPAA
jgi:hypothetical protein